VISIGAGIDRDEWVALYERADHDTALVGERVGLSSRQVERWLRHHGITEPQVRRFCSPEQAERIRVLAAEGMPYTWIGEDVDLDRDVVARVAKGCRPDDAPTQWRQVWGWVKHDHNRLALHDDFAPPVRRRRIS
jgi:hypothetical protein